MKLVFTRQIYFSDEDTIKTIEEGMKIAKREKWSFNKLIGESLKEFVERHREGNVSFQLDKFGVTWNKAISVKKKEAQARKCHCGQPAVYEFTMPDGSRLLTCSKHEVKERAKCWRSLLLV